jgi:hypothetical protein
MPLKLADPAGRGAGGTRRLRSGPQSSIAVSQVIGNVHRRRRRTLRLHFLWLDLLASHAPVLLRERT